MRTLFIAESSAYTSIFWACKGSKVVLQRAHLLACDTFHKNHTTLARTLSKTDASALSIICYLMASPSNHKSQPPILKGVYNYIAISTICSFQSLRPATPREYGLFHRARPTCKVLVGTLAASYVCESPESKLQNRLLSFDSMEEIAIFSLVAHIGDWLTSWDERGYLSPYWEPLENKDSNPQPFWRQSSFLATTVHWLWPSPWFLERLWTSKAPELKIETRRVMEQEMGVSVGIFLVLSRK
jgi:hypothetical protein